MGPIDFQFTYKLLCNIKLITVPLYVTGAFSVYGQSLASFHIHKQRSVKKW